MQSDSVMAPGNIEVAIGENERLDDLQINGFRLIQRKDLFCLGTDSVLLADFAAPKRNETAADLGCGNGALSILLAAHRSDIRIDAIEVQPVAAELARRNVRLNGLEDRMCVLECDMRDREKMPEPNKKSLVICNPPYWQKSDSVVNSVSGQLKSRFEDDLTPAEICSVASRLLKYGGRFCTVFPAQRAFEMMMAMKNAGIEPKRVRSVHYTPDRAAKIVLLEGIRGGGKGLNWLSPLILKDPDGSPSEEWKRIYHSEK